MAPVRPRSVYLLDWTAFWVSDISHYWFFIFPAASLCTLLELQEPPPYAWVTQTLHAVSVWLHALIQVWFVFLIAAGLFLLFACSSTPSFAQTISRSQFILLSTVYKKSPFCWVFTMAAFSGWSTMSLPTSQMSKRRSWLSTTPPFCFAQTGVFE